MTKKARQSGAPSNEDSAASAMATGSRSRCRSCKGSNKKQKRFKWEAENGRLTYKMQCGRIAAAGNRRYTCIYVYKYINIKRHVATHTRARGH